MNRRRRQKAAALIEFALAWPIALLIVFATVESAVWAAETYAARAASLAGARAGSVAGGTATTAAQVTRETLGAALVGVRPSVWCPGDPAHAPAVWICAVDHGGSVEVDVGGTVPALLPLLPGGGLPLTAKVVMQKERFVP